MSNQNIDQEFIKELSMIVGGARLISSEEELISYGKDETEDLCFPPDVVVKPESTKEVSEVLKLCNSKNVSVIPIGARTGLSGGILAVEGGVGVSLERMNKILNLDENNLQVHVQPGVITQELQEFVAEKGLFYPPDPSSRGSCFIGGNLAENAGGPKAVKYGVTKDFVLNLEVVLADGSIINTGANTLKNSTGYNLTQLMVGSEGTLGIITKAVLRLIPMPRHNLLMLVPFDNEYKACEAVAAIFKAGITPSVLEFMEREAIDWVRRFDESINIEVADSVRAHLLIEVDGNHMEVLQKDAEHIYEVMQDFECGEILFAQSEAEKNVLWKMRRRVAEAVKGNTIYKEEDTVVPRYELPRLLEGVKKIGKEYGFQSVCYGHAGDGNLHINIIKGDLSDEDWQNSVVKGVKEIFELTVKLGGTLSGEHGIGWVQKEFMPIAFPKRQLELFRGLKLLFDPKGIMNPSKILPKNYQ